MMSLGRGRGAGVNKPAWLVQKEREEAAAAAASGEGKGAGGDDNGNANANAPPAGPDNDGRYADADEQQQRGVSGGERRERSRSRDRGGEERDQFGRVKGGGGGGGGNHDDRMRGGGGRDNDDRRDHRGGGRRDFDRRDNRRDDFDRRDNGRRGGRDYDRRGGGGGRRDRRRPPSSGIYFHSYEEERDWLDDRRRKRRGRKSVFDIEPTPEQLAEDEARAALESQTTGIIRASTGATGVNTGLNSSGFRGASSGSTMQPQQTRHARRLYVGNIPDLSENEVHNFFRDAIRNSIKLDPETNPNADSHRSQYVDNDPIISVYINRERRFAFLEYKTMEITTACLQLDGIDVLNQGKVKVKRPNDYNAQLAPMINPATAPQLDTAALGIVSTTVPDGPNKIFIGGVPYHLTESQVLELLGAFGTVKAFHLVKQDAQATTSKGYCFVEYADAAITQIACMGLNGMDMGGGKQLSCRMAAQHLAQQQQAQQGAMEVGGGAMGAPVAAPSAQASVVDGVDVDALLSAALGGGGGAMPGMAAMPVATTAAGMGPMDGMMMQQPMSVMPQQQMMGMQQLQPQALDPMAVANAAASALDAAFGGIAAPAAPMAAAPAPLAMPAVQQQPAVPAPSAVSSPTRILVLLNMVMDEDLATAEDAKMLEEEVGEEVSKFGKLLSLKIPKPGDGYDASAVKKIFLEYASPGDAMNAEKELKGRAFGPNVVDAKYFAEDDYANNILF